MFSTHDIYRFAAGFLIQEAWDWNIWYRATLLNKPNSVGKLGTVTVIDRTNREMTDWEFGFSHPVHITFRVEFPDGTERFYRKNGTLDSYGVADWDGEFVEVRAKPKTVTVYEVV